MKLLLMIFIVLLMIVVISRASQQTDAEKVKLLEAQVATLNAKLQPTKQEQAERIYATAYKIARDEAGVACREAGGKLWVMVSRTPGQPTTTSVSCEMK